MSDKMEKIVFNPDQGEPVELFVLEQTMIGGQNYILVTDSEEDDGEAFIMRDVSAPEDSEAVYEPVEDDTELKAVADVFAKMLDDVDLV